MSGQTMLAPPIDNFRSSLEQSLFRAPFHIPSLKASRTESTLCIRVKVVPFILIQDNKGPYDQLLFAGFDKPQRK